MYPEGDQVTARSCSRRLATILIFANARLHIGRGDLAPPVFMPETEIPPLTGGIYTTNGALMRRQAVACFRRFPCITKTDEQKRNKDILKSEMPRPRLPRGGGSAVGGGGECRSMKLQIVKQKGTLRRLLPSFATQNPPPSRREAIGRRPSRW